MSYKQMKYFQDLGDYSAAYKIARADWETDPSLKWPKESIAWLLIKMMKFNARALSKDAFIRHKMKRKRHAASQNITKYIRIVTG